MKRKKAVVIHPAIAPYRIDFFNSINESFETSFYIEFKDVLEQSFNKKHIDKRLSFTPQYLKPGFMGVKNLRLDVFKILKREKPEIVFCSEFNILSFIILACKYLFNWKMKIYTICDDSLEIAEQCKGIRKIMRYVLTYLFTGIILADKRAFDWYKKNLSHHAKFLYFPIIQDNILFRDRLKKTLSLSRESKNILSINDKIVMLYVGRLAKVKNLFFLIDVFEELKKLHDNIILAIVGKGPLDEELREYVKSKNLNYSVLFTGMKEGDELLVWYNIGDIFILPSVFEPFGTVVNEALLAGCYTFCSSVAGASSLINSPYNGQTFSPDDNDEIVLKIAGYLDNNKSHNDLSSIKPDLMQIAYNEQYKMFLSELQNG